MHRALVVNSTVRACMCACMCAHAHARARACVRACVCVCMCDVHATHAHAQCATPMPHVSAPRPCPCQCAHERVCMDRFIDGWHTQEQVLLDFHSIRKRLAPRFAVIFHDVGIFNLWPSIDLLLCQMPKHWVYVTYQGKDYNASLGTGLLVAGLPEIARLGSIRERKHCRP